VPETRRAHERTESSPARVVRVITRLNIGGPSIQAVSLSDRLRGHGFETTLVHGRLGPGEGDMSYLLPAGLEARYLPELQRSIAPLDDARALMKIYRLLARVRPAIVHTHMAKAGAVGRTAAILYNRTVGRHRPARIVHTYHGHVLEGYFNPRKTALFIRAERRLARATDRIIAISPQIRRDLLDGYHVGNAAQYAVVPLGFDLTPFAQIGDADRQQARTMLGLAADARVVTTVGRLTAIKQHALFLEAARHLASDPRTIFLIAGDGELRGDLEAAAHTLGIAKQTRFLGWRRDLTMIYGATDVFALTSRNEGTPVALIEAMAAAVPGVSTDVGGVADVIIDETVGTRVPDGAPEAFARAVNELLARGDRRAMGERARRLVVDRFGIDRLVNDIASLYRSVITAAI
jgi:glycosyltransferase involved in cell wall biosynthesis